VAGAHADTVRTAFEDVDFGGDVVALVRGVESEGIFDGNGSVLGGVEDERGRSRARDLLIGGETFAEFGRGIRAEEGFARAGVGRRVPSS